MGMTNFQFSRTIAAQSRSNFYPSFLFLSAEQKNGLCAIYAFSRIVDDLVDQAKAPEVARRQLAEWRQRLHSCYNGAPAADHPLVPELATAIRRFEIPEPYFLDLLKGMEMDLVKNRYATFAELEGYCYHVAGTVGLLCNQIFGKPGDSHREYALHLGTAFQLTNILRDLGTDLQRDRIYLPLEELVAYSYPVAELQQRVENKKFHKLMQFQAARAHGYFERARQLLSAQERRALMPAEVMAKFYESILCRLEQQKFPSLRKKVSLSLISKGMILAKGWLHWKLA